MCTIIDWGEARCLWLVACRLLLAACAPGSAYAARSSLELVAAAKVSHPHAYKYAITHGARCSSPGLTPAAGAAGPPGESVVWGDPLVCSHHWFPTTIYDTRSCAHMLLMYPRLVDQLFLYKGTSSLKAFQCTHWSQVHVSLLTRKYLNFPSSLHMDQGSVGDFSPTD